MEKAPGSVSIKEIAKKAGFSPAAVSFVLNGRGDEMRIAKETQKKILNVAEGMHYHANVYARRLRHAGKTSAPIVVCVLASEFFDEALGTFVSGLQEFVQESESTGGSSARIEIALYPFVRNRLYEHAHLLDKNRFNGVITVGTSKQDEEFLTKNDFDIPIVMNNRLNRKYSCTYLDSRGVGEKVARMFAARGHKTGGIILWEDSINAFSMTKQDEGFLEGCAKYGIKVRNEWIEKGRRDYTGGFEATCRMLENANRPTALVVLSEMMIGGILEALRVHSVQIPSQAEILCFGHGDLCRCLQPSISTISIPIHEMGYGSMRLLVGEMTHPRSIETHTNIEYKPTYIYRQSCGGLPCDGFSPFA